MQPLLAILSSAIAAIKIPPQLIILLIDIVLDLLERVARTRRNRE